MIRFEVISATIRDSGAGALIRNRPIVNNTADFIKALPLKEVGRVV